MECAGVEDCNNADSDQIINHRQGKKEDAHRRGQERAHARQYGNREGNVGCRGNSPAMYSGGAAEVDSGVDDGGVITPPKAAAMGTIAVAGDLRSPIANSF